LEEGWLQTRGSSSKEVDEMSKVDDAILRELKKILAELKKSKK